MLDLLGGVIGLLLALLASSAQTQDKVKRRLLLDVIIRQSATCISSANIREESL